MKIVELPFDPDGAYEFDDESGTWLPAYCPVCRQGVLNEERGDGGYMYTCFHYRHPMYCCHTRFWVEDGAPLGSLEASMEYLYNLGVM